MIIYGFSGCSANSVWEGRVWNRWGTETPLLWCQQRMLCGVVHRLRWVFDGDHPRNCWRLCGSESASDFCHWPQPQVLSAGCPHHWRFSFAVSLYCLCGQPAFSCWAQALHTTVDRACDDHPSWWHFPPIAAGPWWVWPQSWYTLHCPGPWGLWYGPASRCQLWNGGHTYESSPGSWYACGTVSKSHNHTCPVQHVPACVWWRD